MRNDHDERPTVFCNLSVLHLYTGTNGLHSLISWIVAYSYNCTLLSGGGLIENIPRVLPESLSVSLDPGNWGIPPVFGWIFHTANVNPVEMLRTFNCGLGAVLISSQEDSQVALKLLQENGEEASVIGTVEEKRGHDSVVIEGFSQKLRESCSLNALTNGMFEKKRTRVGVLISGSGTNLQALINQAAKPESMAKIVLVISNVPGVQGLTRAENAGIPTLVSGTSME